MGEGGTPLIKAVNLGMMLGCPNIYIKDERQGPTTSFKDRQASLSITALKEAGISEAVLASTGNLAIAYSAYAARAGIKLWTFLTSLVPPEKMREVAIYGTRVVKVTSSYDQARQVASEFARQRGLYLEKGSRSITSVEAMKTIAYEIAEQLTGLNNTPLSYNHQNHLGQKWHAPDWFIISVSGGVGPYGVLKGFNELWRMGLIDKVPAIAVIQTEGCAPMVKAWKQELDEAEPIHKPRTHITTLSMGNPGRIYTIIKERIVLGGGGTFESVSDEEAYRTIHILAKMEGLSMEPASAVAFAGLIKLVRNGKIKSTDTVVVDCTGHTMPIENTILGDWRVKNLEFPEQHFQDFPTDGLLSALSKVTADRFPCIAIVDDNPEARRLIRRILNSQGEYKIYEASNGKEAIDVVFNKLPDLVILDLMMPEVDGFTVLEELKENPDTVSIPIIVVTAKDLTTEENEFLNGRIQSLMQKGEFLNDQLMDEVKAHLE
jgi:threonine synthase